MTDDAVRLLQGDALTILRGLPSGSVRCCVTSPPYWGLRDYGVAGQIGLEATPDEYAARLVALFAEVRRVLTDDGTLWLNLGDSYANDGKWGGSSGGKHAAALHGKTGIGRSKVSTGLKPKDLVGIPWRVAFALQADGWYLRSDIVWAKPNPMPESVTDRPTRSHEYVFLLTKSAKYYFDGKAIREPVSESMLAACARGPRADKEYQHDTATRMGKRSGNRAFSDADSLARIAEGRNCRDVWTIATQPYPEAHFATFPEELPRRCILAGSKPGDTVLDCFCGSGTSGAVARRLGRNFIGIELNPEYLALAEKRIGAETPPLPGLEVL
jgi:DNA modification methylase